jgi:anthranilate synthase component 1
LEQWAGDRPAPGVAGSTLDPEVAALLKRDAAGLVAAVIQEESTGEVLMVGWMDDLALHRTLTTGRSTFFSRSRGEYWVKGETSGHRQWVREVRLDCDGDTVLVMVHQEGPACHTGDRSCFDRRQLPAVVAQQAEGSCFVSDLSPTLEEFRKLAVERRVIPVYRRLLADADTAIGLYRKLARNRPGTYLLESAEQGVWSRYSFVGVRAAATLTEHDGEAVWSGHAPVGLPAGGDPLAAVGETLRLLHTPRSEELPPFTSGLVGYLSYDAVRRVERLPDTCVDDLRIPEVTFLLASDLAVLDHHNGEVWLVANAINFDNTDERVDEAYADAAARVEEMTELLIESTPAGVVSASFDQTALPIRRQRAPEDYQRAVRSAVEEIKAGEAFQIVVSQRFEVDTTADALDIYRVLRLTNPSPYMYLLRLDDFDIVGSSPEALVSVKGTTAVTHPIAGSKPRGGTPAEDAALEAELLADPKERAEHVMLVDLGRNDLGRVCQPGTVEVVEFMEVRRYSHIMHLESTVTGTIAEDRTALDVVLAAFPAGTLSGAPKVRAMEIIDELEITRRGLYGGVVGYLDFAGDADAAIAIRTAVVRDGVAFVQAGGGIVADSDPPTEDQETQNKAAAVVKAISVAESFASVGPSALLTAESTAE